MSVAEAALARDKPPAALLLRYRPLLVKTVPERHATLAVPRPAPNRAKKTATVLVSAPQNAAVDAPAVRPVKMEPVLVQPHVLTKVIVVGEAKTLAMAAEEPT